ncbi:polyamine ABC transporter substrate-binding protein [Anthocerotibacter panamensis]|uniref:polyamine ABC transporter substrate-binding protein n=1 Tax=Anthocerotibacter panamensis TaxID=2857077 RepID=UPI001C4052AD|nr:spermidine/putrescine ABC transporter substrate-binding protein [Anthocerotibacter panamensis]
MKRRNLWPGLLVLSALVLGTPAQAQKKVLNLYIWSEYIDPQIISDFEKATGSKVVVTLYESNEDMVAKLQGGGVSQYDIVVPTDYIIPTMVKLNLLQPIQKNLIPNFKNLNPKFTNLSFDPGNLYTAPYQWGTVGLAYRKDKVKKAVRSWGLIFDAKQQQGPFTLIDDQRPMIGAAALYLGYDMNTTDKTQLQKVQQVLTESKKRSAGFIGGVGGKNQLLAGTAAVAVVYNGDALRAAKENANIAYLIPQEGANIWQDNLAIPAKAPHLELAHQFINFILNGKVGAQLSNFNQYATPNSSALKFIKPQDLNNPAIYPLPATMAKLYFNKAIKGSDMRLIDALWTNIKSQ